MSAGTGRGGLQRPALVRSAGWEATPRVLRVCVQGRPGPILVGHRALEF